MLKHSLVNTVTAFSHREAVRTRRGPFLASDISRPQHGGIVGELKVPHNLRVVRVFWRKVDRYAAAETHCRFNVGPTN
jgi:hypothetical protein